MSCGSAENARPQKVTYPNGREVYYNYPGNGIGAALNRLDKISDAASPQDDANTYAQYTYLGAGMIVKVAHPALAQAAILQPAGQPGKRPPEAAAGRALRC